MDRLPAGPVENPAVGRHQGEGEDLALSGGGHPGHGVLPPPDVEVVAVRAHEGDPPAQLGRGGPGEAPEDRLLTVQGAAGGGPVAEPHRRQGEAGLGKDLPELPFELAGVGRPEARDLGGRLGEDPVPRFEAPSSLSRRAGRRARSCQELPLLPQGVPVAAQRGESPGVEAHDAAVEEAPAAGRRAGQELHVAGGPGDDGEHVQVLGEGHPGAVDRPVEAPGGVGGVGDREGGPGLGLHLGDQAEGVGAVPDALGEARGAEAPGGGDGVGPFEEAGLAGAVAPHEEVPARAGLPGEMGEVAEGLGFEAGEQASTLSSRAKPRDLGGNGARGHLLRPLKLLVGVLRLATLAQDGSDRRSAIRSASA